MKSIWILKKIKQTTPALALLLFCAGCATTENNITQNNCIQKSEVSALALKNLQQIKQDTAELKTLTNDLGEYSKWLSDYFNGYSKYIERVSVYSPIIKLIPLPYAGQAGDIVKFGSKLTLSITNSAIATNNANKSIAKYEEMLSSANTPEKIAATAKFADEKLVPDLKEAIAKDETLKNMSLSLLSFGESVEKVTASTQDALNIAKSLFSNENAEKEKQQKTLLMRQKLDNIKAKTARIEEIVKKSETLAKRASVYSELLSVSINQN